MMMESVTALDHVDRVFMLPCFSLRPVPLQFPGPIESVHVIFRAWIPLCTCMLSRGPGLSTARSRRRRIGERETPAPGAPAGEARDVKLSLQRTRKMMTEQLERVAQVSEVMGEQDALLRDTFTRHQASRSGERSVLPVQGSASTCLM